MRAIMVARTGTPSVTTTERPPTRSRPRWKASRVRILITLIMVVLIIAIVGWVTGGMLPA